MNEILNKTRCVHCGCSLAFPIPESCNSSGGHLFATTTTTPNKDVKYIHVECPECSNLKPKLAAAEEKIRLHRELFQQLSDIEFLDWELKIIQDGNGYWVADEETDKPIDRNCYQNVLEAFDALRDADTKGGELDEK